MVGVDVAAEHDDRDALGARLLQGVGERLGTCTGGPRVVDDERPNRFSPVGQLSREPIRLELAFASAVPRVGDGGYPRQADPLSAESVKGVPARTSLSARNGDDMGGLALQPAGKAGVMIAQEEQQKSQEIPAGLGRRTNSLVGPKVVVMLTGPRRVGDRNDKVRKDAARPGVVRLAGEAERIARGANTPTCRADPRICRPGIAQIVALKLDVLADDAPGVRM